MGAGSPRTLRPRRPNVLRFQRSEALRTKRCSYRVVVHCPERPSREEAPMLLSHHRRSGSHFTRPRRTRRACLQVEPMEERSLMSVQVLATLGDPAPGPGAAGSLINDFELF